MRESKREREKRIVKNKLVSETNKNITHDSTTMAIKQLSRQQARPMHNAKCRAKSRKICVCTHKDEWKGEKKTLVTMPPKNIIQNPHRTLHIYRAHIHLRHLYIFDSQNRLCIVCCVLHQYVKFSFFHVHIGWDLFENRANDVDVLVPIAQTHKYLYTLIRIFVSAFAGRFCVSSKSCTNNNLLLLFSLGWSEFLHAIQRKWQ